MKDAIVPPAPGIMPSNVPTTAADRLRLAIRRISAKLGSRIRTLSLMVDVAGAARLPHELADREEPDHHEDRLDPEEVRRAVGEPADAGDRVGADGRDHHADDRRGEPLQEGLPRQRGDHAEPRIPRPK